MCLPQLSRKFHDDGFKHRLLIDDSLPQQQVTQYYVVNGCMNTVVVRFGICR